MDRNKKIKKTEISNDRILELCCQKLNDKFIDTFINESNEFSNFPHITSESEVKITKKFKEDDEDLPIVIIKNDGLKRTALLELLLLVNNSSTENVYSYYKYVPCKECVCSENYSLKSNSQEYLKREEFLKTTKYSESFNSLYDEMQIVAFNDIIEKLIFLENWNKTE